jgi:hypothetical protein
MKYLARTGPRVFGHRRVPRYPRALAVGALLLTGACTKAPAEASTTTTATDSAVQLGGAVPQMFDAAPPEALPDAAENAADAAITETGVGDAPGPEASARARKPMPHPAVPGGSPPPYDSPPPH